MSVRRVTALCGGVGGAKLALGLYHLLPADGLTVVVNTGDDFEHLGLHVSPDLDTVLYTLAGLANPATGWGRRDETWTFMQTLRSLGGEGWFELGDGDLALHVERTRRLRAGERLGAVMTDIAAAWGVTARLLPMSDDPVRTVVVTDEGRLPFQRYFVGRRCEPRIESLEFIGAAAARVPSAVLASLAAPDNDAVVICPSNPWLSVDPLLALPALRAALAACPAPVIAVTPIIGGRAVKGPTAKIMSELGLEVTPAAVAAHYAGLIDGFVLDQTDAGLADRYQVPVAVTTTLMQSLEDRVALAREVCAFAARLRRDGAMGKPAARAP